MGLSVHLSSYLALLFQLQCSINQIIDFDGGALFNPYILRILCKYRHKSYINKNKILRTTFVCLDV